MLFIRFSSYSLFVGSAGDAVSISVVTKPLHTDELLVSVHRDYWIAFYQLLSCLVDCLVFSTIRPAKQMIARENETSLP